MTNTTHPAQHAVVVTDPGDPRADVLDAFRARAVALRARAAAVLMPALRPRAPLAGMA
jgi:hypothetical protein